MGFLAGNGGDRLNITGVADSDMSTAWIQSHATQSGVNTVVALNGSESIVLMGVAAANLTPDNFLGS